VTVITFTPKDIYYRKYVEDYLLSIKNKKTIKHSEISLIYI